jgi:hypothetical protein
MKGFLSAQDSLGKFFIAFLDKIKSGGATDSQVAMCNYYIADFITFFDNNKEKISHIYNPQVDVVNFKIKNLITCLNIFSGRTCHIPKDINTAEEADIKAIDITMRLHFISKIMDLSNGYDNYSIVSSEVDIRRFTFDDPQYKKVITNDISDRPFKFRIPEEGTFSNRLCRNSYEIPNGTELTGYFVNCHLSSTSVFDSYYYSIFMRSIEEVKASRPAHSRDADYVYSASSHTLNATLVEEDILNIVKSEDKPIDLGEPVAIIPLDWIISPIEYEKTSSVVPLILSRLI